MYSLGPFNVPYPATAISCLLVTTRRDGHQTLFRGQSASYPAIPYENPQTFSYVTKTTPFAQGTPGPCLDSLTQVRQGERFNNKNVLRKVLSAVGQLSHKT